ncbi:MAG: Gfo/Idh/MocA family oxidoreductase, partial [Bacteroidota bacterium]
MKKYNWGIIGPGKIARKFASDLQLLENAVIYGVASRDLGRARSFAASYHTAVAYGDYHQLISDKKVDIIYIATPHAMHKALTVSCLEAGVPVLCEKPIGLNFTEVEEMVQLAREKQVFLMEALWTACLPHFLFVKSLVDQQRYGAVKKLISDFGFEVPYNPESRLFNRSLGGGSLMDIGIYPVFAAVSLLGVPSSLNAEAIMTETAVDSEMKAVFTYVDGKTAELLSTFRRHTPVETIIQCEDAV